MKSLRPVLVSILLVAAGSVAVTPAAADEPTVTFTTPGENAWTVPAGVTRVDVVAVGGTGGAASTGQRGGRAGRIAATLDVTPGQRLYAVVGADASGTVPGTNGGGAAGGAAGVCNGTPGAGGGATDVRTVAPGQPGSDASRILVAGGGGGAATLGTAGGENLQQYGGHRGLGGGSAERGGAGARTEAGGAAGRVGTGGQTAGTGTTGGRGGVGVAGEGSGCGGGGGGGLGGGGGGAAGPAGESGGGGGGGGSLVPGGFPAGMADRGATPSVTFTAPGRPAPAGPLTVTATQTLLSNDQGAGVVPYANCDTTCRWFFRDSSGTEPGGPRYDFGYISTQAWGSASSTVRDFQQSFLSVRAAPTGTPAAIGEPFLLSTFAHYNEPVRGGSPTQIGVQTLLTVQPPAGPAVVFRLQGGNSIPLNFLETTNLPTVSSCDPSIQQTALGCDDVFTMPPVPRPTTTAAGLTWTVEILGWRTPAGTYETRLVTGETQVVQRDLYARVTVQTVPTTSVLTVGAGTAVTPTLTLTTTPVPQTGGTVTFTDGGSPIPGCTAVPVDAVDGTTTCSPVTPPLGTRTFGAGFDGGVGYAASTAAPVEYTPAAPVEVATGTSLTGPATGTAGQPASFVATVTPTPTGGTVAFADGTAPIAGCTAVPATLGSATCTTSTLGLGGRTLTATYSGTTGFTGSTSPPLAHTVSAPPTTTPPTTTPPPTASDPLAACLPGAPVPTGYTVVRGTGGDDRLVGTGRNDLVLAGAGDDRIATLGGDDIVCAGAGNDEIAAGAGNDQVSGGPGDDSIVGEDGDDVLYGGPGRDRLVGGTGTDRGVDADPGTARVGIERTD